MPGSIEGRSIRLEVISGKKSQNPFQAHTSEGVSEMAGLGTSLRRLQVCGLATGGDALTEFEDTGAPSMADPPIPPVTSRLHPPPPDAGPKPERPPLRRNIFRLYGHKYLRVRRGPPPEDRDFVRIKFKNGTRGDFETYHAFGHKSDIAATEFIYRIENYAITSQKQWAAACSSGLTDD
ncbi:hypothetical protein DFJ58DRAFT_744280 [Suillus subalutaceus]|uniref:uncharacterized protein n=1 Tax=Suillus subalutaceus TaxID=48586 RepID=UPI001B886128|nr:uncharacterized protein DFJ58DRAFT_744280 [Suillus subalutaceus]KAG1861120.1 hypothetical protein DFJ58DRAFT_744280 [Suillus subalutaceus]